MFFAILFVITILIIYVYFKQYHVISTNSKEFDSIEFKTGDILLMKAFNNYNSILHTSYFGHVGMVYVDTENYFINTIDPPDAINRNVYIFEANASNIYPFKSSKDHIFVSPLRNRLEHYSGKIYLKALNHPLSKNQNNAFKDFIMFALKNMHYNYQIFTNGLSKLLGIKKCQFDTDCGQLVFLALIKMNLINMSEYEDNIAHHLNYICKLKLLNNSYFYTDLVRIMPMREEYSFKAGKHICVSN